MVVKIGYLEPELFDMAADWMLALTPGGVDQDLARLGHRRIQRPMFPLDDVSGVDPLADAVLFPGDTRSDPRAAITSASTVGAGDAAAAVVVARRHAGGHDGAGRAQVHLAGAGLRHDAGDVGRAYAAADRDPHVVAAALDEVGEHRQVVERRAGPAGGEHAADTEVGEERQRRRLVRARSRRPCGR